MSGPCPACGGRFLTRKRQRCPHCGAILIREGEGFAREDGDRVFMRMSRRQDWAEVLVP